MEKLLSGKALTLAIASLSKSLKDTVAVIEHLAQSACVEAVKSGNVTHLNKLAKATEHIGSRALMRWIAKHAPVSYDKDTESFVINNDKREKAKADVEAYAEAIAEAKGFIEAAPKSDANPFHALRFIDRVNSLIKQAEEAMKDDDRKGKTDAKGRTDDFAGIEAVKVALAALKPIVSTVAGKPVAKSKSAKGKHVKLTAQTETVATA